MKIYDTHIVSDSGYTCILMMNDMLNVLQHSIAEGCLTEEDRRMTKEPEVVWKEYK